MRTAEEILSLLDDWHKEVAGEELAIIYQPHRRISRRAHARAMVSLLEWILSDEETSDE